MTSTIHWFRQDLRLADNPSLTAAAAAGDVIPIYILDDANAGADKMGAASRVFLHHALNALNASLGGKLQIYQGDPRAIIPAVIARTGAQEIHWNRCYEPWRIARDSDIKASLDIPAQSHNGSLLWEPWQVKKADGTHYRVFTPYFRKGCAKAAVPRTPLPAPNTNWGTDPENDQTVDDLGLLPARDWHADMMVDWPMGEGAVQNALSEFLANNLHQYKLGRDVPALSATSRLSPYLHFGVISPHQIWAQVQGDEENADHYRTELGWREFSYTQLYYNPELPRQCLQVKFEHFDWRNDPEQLRAWQQGQTGIPIVDAGMRELWATGYMHNRVRMIVGSFLVKNLRLDWRDGMAWFWDCLVDADLAANSASWQWVAGCGADAAPYFRVFNPTTQGQRFDADGAYTRKWVPELSAMPDKFLFNPWEAPADVLSQARVTLGECYPHPLVDLKSSRIDALAAFSALKQVDELFE